MGPENGDVILAGQHQHVCLRGQPLCTIDPRLLTPHTTDPQRSALPSNSTSTSLHSYPTSGCAPLQDPTDRTALQTPPQAAIVQTPPGIGIRRSRGGHNHHYRHQPGQRSPLQELSSNTGTSNRTRIRTTRIQVLKVAVVVESIETVET